MTLQPPLVSGYRSPSVRATASISACARASDAAGARRASTITEWLRRSCSAAATLRGRQMSRAGDLVERTRVVAPLEKVAGGRVDGKRDFLQVTFAERHDPIEMRDSGRAQQQRVDDGEDRGVRADPEREGEHRDCGETRLAPQ